jgi:hypothetical protein
MLQDNLSQNEPASPIIALDPKRNLGNPLRVFHRRGEGIASGG